MRSLLLTFILVIAIFNFSGMLWGQSAANTGQIVGQVLDPSGGSVAGAEITVRNRDTNFSRRTATDTAGRYVASYLPLGPYEVTVRASGFETPSQDAFVTQGSSMSANFNLSLGGTSESVEVTADAPGIEPTRTAPKSILTDLQIHS